MRAERRGAIKRVLSGLMRARRATIGTFPVRRTSSQSLFWICLLVIGLGASVLRTGLVLCSDVHGGSRIEWGCQKTVEGECQPLGAARGSKTADDEDPCGPHPCEDIPLEEDVASARIAPRADAPPILLPLHAARLEFSAVEIRCDERAEMRSVSTRPPDIAARLRTVILLV